MKNDEVECLGLVRKGTGAIALQRKPVGMWGKSVSHTMNLLKCSKLSHANSTNGPFHLSNMCGDIFVEVSNSLCRNSYTLKLLIIDIK